YPPNYTRSYAISRDHSRRSTRRKSCIYAGLLALWRRYAMTRDTKVADSVSAKCKSPESHLTFRRFFCAQHGGSVAKLNCTSRCDSLRTFEVNAGNWGAAFNRAVHSARTSHLRRSRLPDHSRNIAVCHAGAATLHEGFDDTPRMLVLDPRHAQSHGSMPTFQRDVDDPLAVQGVWRTGTHIGQRVAYAVGDQRP